MKKAPVPENEADRLATLRSYCVLDTAPDPLYDDLTELAASVCETPIALISLIDSDRQWFKSRHGLDAQQTDRDISFCGHAILQQDIFIVEDAAHDIRFSDNPLVAGATRVRFYAGVPLMSPSGQALGTLCVIDHVARKLTSVQIDLLKNLSRQVTAQLEARRMVAQMLAKNDELKLAEARLIQASKMASLGEMAGGVAHEINNPLTIIVTRVEDLIFRYSENSETRENILSDLEKIQITVGRITSIVKGLRAFSRNSEKDPFCKVKVDLVIADTVALCAERFTTTGVGLTVTAPQDVEIECRGSQISQVLVNLLNNSYDAIKNLENKWIRLECFSDGQGSVLISVSDSGGGVPAEIRDKIMQPFFTTKEAGKGTGLGLSVSRSMVADHGGHFWLDTHASYTRFVVKLPILQNPRIKIAV